MSKIEKARTIYAANAGKTRLEIIDILQKELGLARGTASGYHDSCKKAAQKVAPAAAVAIAAMADAPKLSAPATETKSAIVAAAAEAAGVPVVDISVSKYKNVAGESAPLHNFTTAEMLEVLDEQTRKDVEAFLSKGK